ncbi:MAG: hypothetical protein MK101_02965 [Phycisphaerales bacterium]|nr:hypothetical protein [Phycisphaerales bacterium]
MRRRLIIIAITLVVAAFASVLTGFVMSLAAVDLQAAHLPSKAVLKIDAPGTWLLWKGDGAGGEPRLRSDPAQLLAPAPTTRSITFVDGGQRWQVSGRFEFDARGQWTFDGGSGDWALSPDPLPSVKVWSLVTVSLAIVLLGSAACTGWIAFRRPSGGQLQLRGEHEGG